MALVALDVALEIIESVKRPLEMIGRHDRDLKEQGRRATNSIVLNVGEGSRRRGRDRTHLFSIAAGSAGELQTVLRASQRWGYLQETDVTPAWKLLDRELALLWGLGARVVR